MKQYFLNIFRSKISGRKRFQKLFNLIRNLSLQGLNFGNGSAISTSGEVTLIQFLNKKFNEARKYIIFDVGANQGDYCKALIEHLQTGVIEIWCFEPSKFTFDKLAQNYSANSKVILNCIGFSDTTAESPLYTNEEGAHIASLYPLERAFGAKEKLSSYEMVSLITIDDFIEKNNIPYIDFLKLDIEGNELKALIGAKRSLENKLVRSIQFEFGSCNIDSRTYFRDFWYLLSDRYNIYRVLKDGLQPIEYYSEYDEVFVTINYYAELKQ